MYYHLTGGLDSELSVKFYELWDTHPDDAKPDWRGGEHPGASR